LDFLIHNPRFVIEAYLYKIQGIILMNKQVLRDWAQPLLYLLLSWTVASTFITFYSIRDLNKIFSATLCMSVASLAPLIYAYPTWHAAGDHVFVMGLFVLVLGFTLTSFARMGISSLRRRLKEQVS